MLVLDLCCAADHRFEGWFASSEDFASQRDGRRLSCPLCGHAEVRRVPSAARLNVSHLKRAPAAAARSDSPGSASQPDVVLQRLRQWVHHSEDLGERFAEEARRMHHGEIETRAIRGQASAAEAVALLEEGIDVLPLPPALLEPLH